MDSRFRAVTLDARDEPLRVTPTPEARIQGDKLGFAPGLA